MLKNELLPGCFGIWDVRNAKLELMHEVEPVDILPNTCVESWGQLLRQAKLHGWKFKPAKTEFGFEEIVTGEHATMAGLYLSY